MKTVFTCRQCGKCCEGKGGIVLSPKDLARLARRVAMSEDQVSVKYAEISNGKLKLRVGADGFCVFFSRESGCVIHEDKPDICKAWPFFRGNLVDQISFAMARDFCPGIDASASHAEFVSEGMRYLRRNFLIAGDRAREANALMVDRQTGKDAL